MTGLASYLIVASSFLGQAVDVKVPANVLAEMEYLVGDWVMEGKLGEELHKAEFSYRWAPSKMCLNCDWVWSGPTETSKASEITGWDGGTQELVQVEFGSQADTATVRFKIKSKGVWEGHGIWSAPEPDGGFKAAVRFEKRNENEWVWTATDVKGIGKEPPFSKAVLTFRRVTRGKQ